MKADFPQTYLVGGAVRDEILGINPKERDWVVTGSTPQAMHEQGFQPVGKDFPVFIHPQSGEEYALARTERKSGIGYHGFTFNADPQVSLEQDLERRDLTINAIAKDSQGKLIDPYSGQSDIEARVLRHVSPAFSEDPLRILRVARFAARFHHLGFRIASETLGLMRQMAVADELSTVSSERVWTETVKALHTDAPHIFFQSLRNCGALQCVYPEIDQLFGIPQPVKYHPEIDTGIHTLMSLERICCITADPVCRFAVLVHDLGKGVTEPEQWPNHRGHEGAGVAVIDELARRLGIGKKFERLAKLVSKWHLHSHRALELKPATVLKLFDNLDVWRRPETLDHFLMCCQADAQGRTGLENKAYPQANYLRQAFLSVKNIDGRRIAQSHSKGANIGKAIEKARLDALTEFKSSC